jgi:hypothetical protein
MPIQKINYKKKSHISNKKKKKKKKSHQQWPPVLLGLFVQLDDPLPDKELNSWASADDQLLADGQLPANGLAASICHALDNTNTSHMMRMMHILWLLLRAISIGLGISLLLGLEQSSNGELIGVAFLSLSFLLIVWVEMEKRGGRRGGMYKGA